MTKVYLVFARNCEADGKICKNSEEYIMQVFTNKRLANKYADYMNREWRLGFQRNADFKKECILWYFVATQYICKDDYSKLPF